MDQGDDLQDQEYESGEREGCDVDFLPVNRWIPKFTSTPSLPSTSIANLKSTKTSQPQSQSITSSTMGPPNTSQVLKNKPSTSSNPSPFPKKSNTSSPQSPRESFFANWDKDYSAIEDRFKSLKRRFPGPAGLLPPMSRNETRLLADAEHPLSQFVSKIISADLSRIRNSGGGSGGPCTSKEEALVGNEVPQLIPMSNHDREILKMNKGPWRELVKLFNLNPTDPAGLLMLMNIRWLRKKLSKHPVTTQIPFLALVVQEEPEILGSKRRPSDKKKNPSIRLMDYTGTIVAAMDASFVDNYGIELSPGTAIAVKNAGFLRFKKQLILTVNKKNIICITSVKKSEGVSCEKKIKFVVSKSSMSSIRPRNGVENDPIIKETNEGIRILRFTDFSLQKAMEEYQQIQLTSFSITGKENCLNNGNINGHGQTSTSLSTITSRRPASVSGSNPAISRTFGGLGNEMHPSPSTHHILTGSSRSPPPPRNISSAPPGNVQNYSASISTEEDDSMFDDEDEDELNQAFEALEALEDLETHQTNTENSNNSNDGSN